MQMLVLSFIVSGSLFILTVFKVIDQNIGLIGLYFSVILLTISFLIFMLKQTSLKRNILHEKEMKNIEKELNEILKEQIEAHTKYEKSIEETNEIQKTYINQLKELIKVKDDIISTLKKNQTEIS